MVLSRRKITASMLSVCALLVAPMVSSFQPSGRTVTISSPLAPSGSRPSYQDAVYPSQQTTTKSSSTSLNMFMGSDGGLFGIGTPELATILLVGYFVLGPSDLYKLVKEIGKFVQNVRTLGNDATKAFESNMESQLEFQELRKAQQELNDAFSFRRSINVDDEAEAFATNAQSPRPQNDVGEPVAAAAAATANPEAGEAPPKRKKKRRRVKKKAPEPEPEPAPINNNVPDLDMSDSASPAPKKEEDWFADSEDGTKLPSASEMAKEDMEWLKESEKTTTPVMEKKDPKVESAEQSRFQQQMSGNWNQMVLDNEDKLGPMALVMEQLALLEEERAAAEKRLDEEFTARYKQEEEFYRKKRELLEDAAAKVQQEAYITMEGSSSKN